MDLGFEIKCEQKTRELFYILAKLFDIKDINIEFCSDSRMYISCTEARYIGKWFVYVVKIDFKASKVLITKDYDRSKGEGDLKSVTKSYSKDNIMELCMIIFNFFSEDAGRIE